MTHLYRPPATALGPVPSLKASNKLSSRFLAYRLTPSSSILSPKILLTSSANFSSTKTRAFGRITLLLRDDATGRETGLVSIDGFLELSLDDRCRLIGFRWRSSASASEPESEEVEEPSASSSEWDSEDGPVLSTDARVCGQCRHRRTSKLLTLICLRLPVVTSPARGDGDLYVFTS